MRRKRKLRHYSGIGGQAVLEGVMMKSKKYVALSVRQVNGNIVTEVEDSKTIASKHKFFRIPIIRGIVGFVESLILSTKTLSKSAEMLGIEEEESKFEKWLREKFGKSIAYVASAIGIVLGVAVSVGLFFVIPAVISDFVARYTDLRIIKSLVDGFSKIIIFLCYLAVVSLIPDMKRVFQYHGAEHKSIFCHEAEIELTPENVKKQCRFHPRCGTSFLFILMIIGILVSVIYIETPIYVRIPLKILFLPLVVGIGYEFIRYAGKHNNLFVKIVSAPGLWIQRLTTKEPDLKQIEVAIASLKAALPDIYPPEEKENASEEAQAEIISEEEKNDGTGI
ncbi:MAG: DUF1385 domain-containing protein [Clostridia bacterium]|nr:DUF1385 domain-containing protein [Clostridia bacterium]